MVAIITCFSSAVGSQVEELFSNPAWHFEAGMLCVFFFRFFFARVFFLKLIRYPADSPGGLHKCKVSGGGLCLEKELPLLHESDMWNPLAPWKKKQPQHLGVEKWLLGWKWSRPDLRPWRNSFAWKNNSILTFILFFWFSQIPHLVCCV